MTNPDVRVMPKSAAWQDRAIAMSARWMIKPNLSLPLPWSTKRRSFAFAGWSRPTAPGIRYEPVKIGERTGALYTPRHPSMRIFWIHGGGFVIGSPKSHQGMLSHLAKAANAAVFVPKYRRAPEHPFPAAVDDVEAAFDAIQGLRPDLGPLVLGGDSAGGTLALVGLARSLAKVAPAFAGAILISPATDLDPNRDIPDADDLLFPLRMFHRVKEVYVRDADPRDPRLSPIHGDYTGAPPVLIHCSTREYLETDSDAIAARLAEQGTAVTLEKYQNLPHVFHFMAGSSPSANDAIERLARFARTQAEGVE